MKKNKIILVGFLGIVLFSACDVLMYTAIQMDKGLTKVDKFIWYAVRTRKGIYNRVNKRLDKANKFYPLYKKYSENLVGKEEYDKIYQQLNDTINHWSKHKVGVYRFIGVRDLVKIDSLLCFNKKKDRFVTAYLCGTKHHTVDNINVLYGAKVKGVWYFFGGAGYMIPHRFYVDTLKVDAYKPLSFDMLHKIAMDIPLSGYLRRVDLKAEAKKKPELKKRKKRDPPYVPTYMSYKQQLKLADADFYDIDKWEINPRFFHVLDSRNVCYVQDSIKKYRIDSDGYGVSDAKQVWNCTDEQEEESIIYENMDMWRDANEEQKLREFKPLNKEDIKIKYDSSEKKIEIKIPLKTYDVYGISLRPRGLEVQESNKRIFFAQKSQEYYYFGDSIFKVKEFKVSLPFDTIPSKIERGKPLSFKIELCYRLFNNYYCPNPVFIQYVIP